MWLIKFKGVCLIGAYNTLCKQSSDNANKHISRGGQKLGVGKKKKSDVAGEHRGSTTLPSC